jgi:hypothetical protein
LALDVVARVVVLTRNRFQKEMKATRKGRRMKMKIAYMKVSLFGLWVDTPFMIPHIFCCKQNKQDDTNKLSTFEE